MKNHQNKKARLGQCLAIVFYALIGVFCGILIVMYLERAETQGRSMKSQILAFLLLFIAMYAIMLVQIVIHEAGHLLFGLITGYRFCSFRILQFMWVRSDDRIRFKRLHLAGTGGQCLMAPPDLTDGTMPVQLYNYGGSILNAISAVVFLGISLLCPAGSLSRTILLLFTVIGFAFAVMNGLPLRIGPVNNDGCNARDLARDPESVRAFWTQMKVNELISEGVRLKDMPEEWFTVPSDEAMRNGITATVGLLACNRLMDEHRFEEADRLMEHMLSLDSGVAGLARNLTVCDRIYVELIGRNRSEALDTLMSREQKKIMKAMRTNPSVLRTEYACALIAHRDTAEAEKTLKAFNRAIETYPYPGEIQAEQELIALAQQAQTPAQTEA